MPPRKRVLRSDDVEFQRRLGQTVRTLRKPTASQDDFADLVGVYRSHMGLIEQGKLDLRLSTLLALARALKLPLSQLIAQAETASAQES